MSNDSHETGIEADGGAKTLLARITESIRRKYETQCLSFKIHAFVFAVCSAGFVFLNSISTHFPWAFFPIAGWIVGLGGHLQALLNRRRELGQLTALPNVPDETLRLLREYQRRQGIWGQHRAAYLTANAYLWGINAITSMAFPWAAIVSGGWGIGIACHWMANSAGRKRLKRKLKELGTDPDALSPAFGASGRLSGGIPHPLTDQARALAGDMAAKYKSNKGFRSHWAEIEPLIGTALAQIEELETKSIEFDRLTASISDGDIERDLAELKRKRASAETELLTKEYDRSIAQYQAHLKASSDLRQHREILDLRLSGAINLIKQLDIDSVRLLSLDAYEEPVSLSLLRDKTNENQAFLEDFREGLEKLGNHG